MMTTREWREVLSGVDQEAMDALILVAGMVDQAAEAEGCACGDPDCDVTVLESAAYVFRTVLLPTLARSVIATAAVKDGEVMRRVADEAPALANELSNL